MTTPIPFYMRRNHTATTYALSTSPHAPNCRRPPSRPDIACSLCTLIHSSYVVWPHRMLCCAELFAQALHVRTWLPELACLPAILALEPWRLLVEMTDMRNTGGERLLPPRPSWTCAACTLCNAGHAATCEACESERPLGWGDFRCGPVGHRGSPLLVIACCSLPVVGAVRCTAAHHVREEQHRYGDGGDYPLPVVKPKLTHRDPVRCRCHSSGCPSRLPPGA